MYLLACCSLLSDGATLRVWGHAAPIVVWVLNCNYSQTRKSSLISANFDLGDSGSKSVKIVLFITLGGVNFFWVGMALEGRKILYYIFEVVLNAVLNTYHINYLNYMAPEGGKKSYLKFCYK